MTAVEARRLRLGYTYEELMEHCRRLAGLGPGASAACVQQILGEFERMPGGTREYLLAKFAWPLARWADAHAVMDQEMELLRQRLHQAYALRINPPLVYMEGYAPVKPDTRSYWRRVWDALLNRRADSASEKP